MSKQEIEHKVKLLADIIINKGYPEGMVHGSMQYYKIPYPAHIKLMDNFKTVEELGSFIDKHSLVCGIFGIGIEKDYEFEEELYIGYNKAKIYTALNEDAEEDIYYNL